MARTWIAGSLGASLALLALALGTANAAPPPLPKGEKASIATDDGLTLVGTWWAAGDPKGPAVVVLPAEGADRGSLLAVVPELLDRRLGVLTLDLRGHGESAKQKAGDLAAKAKAGDEAVLKATALDVLAAARWLVKTKGRDATKVGVLAVGRSALVALDAAGRTPGAVRAVVALSPVGKAPGLDGDALAKAVPPGTAVLLVAHQDHAAEGAEPLAAALTAARQGATGAAPAILRRPETAKPEASAADTAWFRGLPALKRVPLLKAYVGGFLARELGAAYEALLDGDVAEESDPAKAGAWTKATAVPTEGGSAYAYRVDRRVVFGGTMPAGFKYLELKIRAYGPGVNWERIAQGIIDLGNKERHATASVLLEAPEAHFRTGHSGWFDLEDDWDDGEGAAKKEDESDLPPGMPNLPPGMPKPPGGWGGGGSGQGTPFHVVFRPSGDAFTFEGYVLFPVIKGAKVPKVDVQVGWKDQMPGMPSRIPMGPVPMDLGGEWTELVSK